MEQKLREAIKNAMKAKMKNGTNENVAIYQTRKNILENAQKIAKDKKIEITDSIIYDAAKKEIKQLNDLMEFVPSDNTEKIFEIAVSIETAREFLPKMATEDDIKTFISSNKDKANNIGAMMKLLKDEFGDSLDGKMASQIVKTSL